MSAPAAGVETGSLTAMVRARAADKPAQTAFRYKARGVWRDVSWGECAHRAGLIARGLQARGIGPGDCVMLGAPASPGWVLGLLGVHGAGALPLSVYQTFATTTLANLFAEQAPKAVIGELSWLEMLVDSGLRLPATVIASDEQRPAHWGVGDALMLADLEAAGDDSWDAAIAAGGEHPAILLCTAGTTGPPRVVAHSTRSLVAAAKEVAQPGEGPGLGPKDSVVVEMPTGHLAAVLTAVVLPVVAGVMAYLPEGRPADAVREVHPTLSINIATVWERAAARIQVVARGTHGLKGHAFRIAQRARRTNFDPRRPIENPRGFFAHLAYGLVFLPMLTKFGYERLRSAYVVGVTSPEAICLWRTWGVDLTQAYGLAEAGIMVGRAVGQAVHPVLGMELQVRSGRVAVRGASVGLGYRQAGELRPAADAGGWLDTGDAGVVLPDGVHVLGPAPQVLPGTGFTVPLALIDAAFRYSPYLRSAVTSAGAGGDLGALLDLDFAAIARWATTTGISFRSRTALLESDAVGRLLADELEEANTRLTAQGLPIVRSISLAPTRFTPGIEINALGSARRVPEADSVHNPAVTTSAIGDRGAHHAL